MISLVPGHNRTRRGAVSIGGVSENPWALLVCQAAAEALLAAGIPAQIVERQAGAGEYRDLAQRTRGSTGIVEVHFDIAEGPSRGTLGLHWPGSVRGARLAELLAAHVAEAAGLPNRGARGQAKSWAGSDLSYRYTEAPHAILEACDGTDPRDWAAVDEAGEIERIGRAIAEAVRAWELE